MGKKLPNGDRESKPEGNLFSKIFSGNQSGVSQPVTSLDTFAPQQRVKIKSSRLDDTGPIEPNPRLGKRKLKNQKKQERDKTKGSKWFNLPAAEIDEQRKYDLQALKLRKAIDSKAFYKRNNMPSTPKYFQVGRVIESPADFYHSRIPRKQRKTIAQELLEGVEKSR